MAKLFGKKKKAFEAEGKDGMEDRSVLPAGEYVVRISESSREQTKSKTGFYVSLKFEVIKGQHKGRFIFRNLNLENDNDQTVEIAEKELVSICNACGLDSIEDSEELHGIPMIAKVAIKKGNDEYGDQNVIRTYKAYESDEEEDEDEIKPKKKGKKKDKDKEKGKKKKKKKASFDD